MSRFGRPLAVSNNASTRNVWIYKDANYELFYKISDFDWSCLHQGTVNEASSLFTNIYIEFAKLCIPSKTSVV